jgi:hypothetical protein
MSIIDSKMATYNKEKTTAQILIDSVLQRKEELPYINVGAGNEYLGWVICVCRH